ncbi:MAG: hypothetical protein H6961_08390 [Chromatiaceae bacterium]|nr:hypothetical protein [Chromatiaceae bacterium]
MSPLASWISSVELAAAIARPIGPMSRLKRRAPSGDVRKYSRLGTMFAMTRRCEAVTPMSAYSSAASFCSAYGLARKILVGQLSLMTSRMPLRLASLSDCDAMTTDQFILRSSLSHSRSFSRNTSCPSIVQTSSRNRKPG